MVSFIYIQLPTAVYLQTLRFPQNVPVQISLLLVVAHRMGFYTITFAFLKKDREVIRIPDTISPSSL
jgi:hypothetical protein